MTVSFDLADLRRRSGRLTPFQWTVYGLVSFFGHGALLLLFYSLSQGPGGDRAQNAGPQSIDWIEVSSAELLARVAPPSSPPAPDAAPDLSSSSIAAASDASAQTALQESREAGETRDSKASDTTAELDRREAEARNGDWVRPALEDSVGDRSNNRPQNRPQNRPNNLFRNPLQGLNRRITPAEPTDAPTGNPLAENPPTENPPAENPPAENSAENPSAENTPNEPANPPIATPSESVPTGPDTPSLEQGTLDPLPSAEPELEGSGSPVGSGSPTDSGESTASSGSTSTNPSSPNSTLPQPGVGSTVRTDEPDAAPQPPTSPSQAQGTAVTVEGVDIQVLEAETRDIYAGRDLPERFAEFVPGGSGCAIAPDEQLATNLNQPVQFLLIITDQGQVEAVNPFDPNPSISLAYANALDCQLRAARFLPAQQANKPTFGQVVVNASIRGRVN